MNELQQWVRASVVTTVKVSARFSRTWASVSVGADREGLGVWGDRPFGSGVLGCCLLKSFVHKFNLSQFVFFIWILAPWRFNFFLFTDTFIREVVLTKRVGPGFPRFLAALALQCRVVTLVQGTVFQHRGLCDSSVVKSELSTDLLLGRVDIPVNLVR